MAFADWLLPLLLITLDDEHGRAPFDWAALDALPVRAPHRDALGDTLRFDTRVAGSYRGRAPGPAFDSR